MKKGLFTGSIRVHREKEQRMNDDEACSGVPMVEPESDEVPCKGCKTPTVFTDTKQCNTCRNVEFGIGLLVYKLGKEEASKVVESMLEGF